MAVKTFTLADVDIPSTLTATQVSSTATPITSIIFQAHPSNTGNIYVGDVSVSATRGIALAPGEVVAVSADLSGRAGGDELILSDWYLATATNGNDAKISYQKRR